MTGTLTALTRLAPPPRSRLASAVVLGAVTLVFGIGLMALAGYLISRAAEGTAPCSRQTSLYRTTPALRG